MMTMRVRVRGTDPDITCGHMTMLTRQFIKVNQIETVELKTGSMAIDWIDETGASDIGFDGNGCFGGALVIDWNCYHFRCFTKKYLLSNILLSFCYFTCCINIHSNGKMLERKWKMFWDFWFVMNYRRNIERIQRIIGTLLNWYPWISNVDARSGTN